MVAPDTDEQKQISAIVARFEADTGIQAVAAVSGKADAYPDIPWKAYAMGSALGAVAAALNPFLVTGWSHAGLLALDAMLILAGGAVFALLSVFVPAFARIFLDGVRAGEETLQYAKCMFLEHQLFRTKNRRAVLVVMCRFERLAVLLTDTGLRQYVSHAALAEIGHASGAMLTKAGSVAAFETAFARLKDELGRGGFVGAPAEQDGIADDVIVEQRS